MDSNQSDAGGEETIKCVFCKLPAPLDALKQHISEDHFNCFPYKCEICGVGTKELGGIFHHGLETGHHIEINGSSSQSAGVLKLLEMALITCIKEHQAAKQKDGEGFVQVEPSRMGGNSRQVQSANVEAAVREPPTTRGGEIVITPGAPPSSSAGVSQSAANAFAPNGWGAPMRYTEAAAREPSSIRRGEVVPSTSRQVQSANVEATVREPPTTRAAEIVHSRQAQSSNLEAAAREPSSVRRTEIVTTSGAPPGGSVHVPQPTSYTATLARLGVPINCVKAARVEARKTGDEGPEFNASQTTVSEIQGSRQVTDIFRRKVSPLRAPSVHSRATQSARRDHSTRGSKHEIPSAGNVCELCDKVISGSRRDHVASKHSKFAFRCPVSTCDYETLTGQSETTFRQLQDHISLHVGGRGRLSKYQNDDVKRQTDEERSERLRLYERCFPSRDNRKERRNNEKGIQATPSARRHEEERRRY